MRAPHLRTAYLVRDIVNGQSGLTSEAHLGHRFIVNRQPKISEFSIAVINAGVTDPKGRVFCRLTLDSRYREVMRFHPDFSPVQELALSLWRYFQHIKVSICVAVGPG